MEYSDKQIAAQEAVRYIKDGMVIGIGSGSTVNEFLYCLAARMRKERLQVVGIPASKKSERLATELGIPLTTFATYQNVDIAIDGTDEIDDQLYLVKGGGGSLVREKMIDLVAETFIVIASGKKKIKKLGSFPVPVEVVPFGWQATEQRLQQFGCQTNLRMVEEDIFVSDNQNYIIDCDFKEIDDAEALHRSLKQIVGVIETGIFINMVDKAIVADNGELSILEK
ncbi:ribose 5-phosphate isomerase [Oceanobacillus iheyensis HTE831]|uniref:Ribose-5-phosphate isomerase A 2 n=1 Tax=Oceanobacillus iheyensis (strain DSM 14371 / CIP 107618 / JCM 11309 / KCTC 3954 / HTE831) TaxID=221109 RepID=RPIA2_OCEIH|nr:ribose-5-phosphate isomerase RpiA [Oceanobacillus iheyensis]Q8EMZ1.1 RecName: Full=Ribose-5-phosphate isomerase A 2; AltName: Full=Phosphoriboisomerase A 2; Short=PRI 2 [Oceanobacillus iheyensis HTE831]BAC14655.1 ribose 5-phosphate isomerase [Oceanobacillus iheyensis HTE831]